MGVAKNIRLGMHRLGLIFAALPLIGGLAALGMQEGQIATFGERYESNLMLAGIEPDPLFNSPWINYDNQKLLRDFRAKFPQYDDMDDVKLIDALYRKREFADEAKPLVEPILLIEQAHQSFSAYTEVLRVRDSYPMGAGIAIALSILAYSSFRIAGWILSGFFGE